MCLDIKNFYLTAAMDYYECMKIPLALFPEWIKKQYNLNTRARDGFVFLEIQRAVWGLPQAGILATNYSKSDLSRKDIMSVSIHPDFGGTQPD